MANPDGFRQANLTNLLTVSVALVAATGTALAGPRLAPNTGRLRSLAAT